MSRSCGVFLLAAIVIVILGIAVIFRPTPITGFNGDDLAASVNGGGPFSNAYSPCKERGEAWTCTVRVNLERGDSDYNVGHYTVDDPSWFGCWSAQRNGKGSPGDGLESTLDGCITIFDHW